jgi:RecA/RadA recombinase
VHLLRNIQLDKKQAQTRKNEGWVTPEFLGLLTTNEWKIMFQIGDSTENEQQLKKTREKLRNTYGRLNWRHTRTSNGLETIETQEISSWPSRYTISSGSRNVDSLLDNNGFTAGHIALLYGRFRSGKSQICHQLCVSAYQHFHSSTPFPSKIALFLDTEGTFRPERIYNMAQAFSLDPISVLNQIYVISANTYSELNLAAIKLQEIIEQYHIKIVVIDSLTAPFRVESSRETKSVKTKKNLIKLLQFLKRIAQECAVPIVCTSQVTATTSDMNYFNILPSFSTILSGFIKQWIMLGEDEAITSFSENVGRRYAHLINGEQKKSEIVQFRITPEGIRDFFI